MLINGKNYLLLRRMGCNYHNNDTISTLSDVGNHRVRVQFTDKNGVDVLGDFSHGYKWDTSKKKPYMISMNALSADLQYENEDGAWVYRPSIPVDNYTYNLADILQFVNANSAEQYDAIKWVQYFDFIQEAGKNFTPAAKIYEYAKTNRLEVVNTKHFDTVLRMYSGYYKYLCYSIKPTDNGKEIVTIIMEEATA